MVIHHFLLHNYYEHHKEENKWPIGCLQWMLCTCDTRVWHGVVRVCVERGESVREFQELVDLHHSVFQDQASIIMLLLSTTYPLT